MLAYLEVAGLAPREVGSVLDPEAARTMPDRTARQRRAPRGWLARAYEALKNRLARGRMVAELSRMSDRQLSDIGITRYGIPVFAAAAVRGVDQRQPPQLRGAAVSPVGAVAGRPPAAASNDNEELWKRAA